MISRCRVHYPYTHPSLPHKLLSRSHMLYLCAGNVLPIHIYTLPIYPHPSHRRGRGISYTLHTAYILSICFNHDHHGVGAGGLLGCWAVPYSYIYIFCLCNRWQLVDVAGADGGIVYTYNIVCICYMCLKIHVCLLYMCACFFLALY